MHAKNEMIKLDSLVENQEGLLWFWALWECAQFCVQSKLKTPLGKASDTFLAIEGVLKFIYNSDSNCNSTSLFSYLTKRWLKLNNFFQVLNRTDWCRDVSRISLLMHFIELLEKLIYNASEGTTSSLQTFSKVFTHFS